MKKTNIKISKKELMGFLDTWHSWCGDLDRNCIDDCGEYCWERCRQAKKIILALIREKNAKK